MCKTFIIDNLQCVLLRADSFCVHQERWAMCVNHERWYVHAGGRLWVESAIVIVYGRYGHLRHSNPHATRAADGGKADQVS